MKEEVTGYRLQLIKERQIREKRVANAKIINQHPSINNE